MAEWTARCCVASAWSSKAIDTLAIKIALQFAIEVLIVGSRQAPVEQSPNFRVGRIARC